MRWAALVPARLAVVSRCLAVLVSRAAALWLWLAVLAAHRRAALWLWLAVLVARRRAALCR